MAKPFSELEDEIKLDEMKSGRSIAAQAIIDELEDLEEVLHKYPLEKSSDVANCYYSLGEVEQKAKELQQFIIDEAYDGKRAGDVFFKNHKN